MENIFVAALFVSFVVVRILSHALHDKKNYGTTIEKSKTLTGMLRKKTGKDIHHLHIGFLLILIVGVLYLIFGINVYFVALFAIGISMFVDQVVPMLDRKVNYFHARSLVLSFIFHVIIAGIVIWRS